MPTTASVQVRQTTTTTTSRASVLVINTGYLTSRFGLLKLILLILALICFILIIFETGFNYYTYGNYRGYFCESPVMFVLLVSFANWYAIALMLIAALLSLGSASLLPKTSFDFIFHFVGCVLFLISGLWLAVFAFDDYNHRTVKLKISAVLAITCGILHLVHGIFSYRLCITN